MALERWNDAAAILSVLDGKKRVLAQNTTASRGKHLSEVENLLDGRQEFFLQQLDKQEEYKKVEG